MEVKTIKDVLKFHNEFVEKVKKQAEIVRSGRGITPGALVKEKEQILERFSTSLKAVTVAKTKAVKRYDEDIRYNKEMISRLKKEIDEEKKALKRATTKAAKKSKDKK